MKSSETKDKEKKTKKSRPMTKPINFREAILINNGNGWQQQSLPLTFSPT
jgi:hypothetical protein